MLVPSGTVKPNWAPSGALLVFTDEHRLKTLIQLVVKLTKNKFTTILEIVRVLLLYLCLMLSKFPNFCFI